MTLPGAESLGERTIDDIIGCLGMFNKGDHDQLKKMIPDEQYYGNFVALARNIAPDGEVLYLVGFSSVRNGELRTVSLTGQNIEPVGRPLTFAASAAQSPEAAADLPTVIEGFLKEADSRNSKKGKIQVVDQDGTSHTIYVLPEMMSDIVKPLWDSQVVIVGERRKKSLYLTDIRQAKPTQKPRDPSV